MVFGVAITGAGVVPVCAAGAIAYLGIGCVAATCFCADGGDCCGTHPADAGDAGHAHHGRVPHDPRGVADVGFADVTADSGAFEGADGMLVGDAFDATGGG